MTISIEIESNISRGIENINIILNTLKNNKNKFDVEMSAVMLRKIDEHLEFIIDTENKTTSFRKASSLLQLYTTLSFSELNKNLQIFNKKEWEEIEKDVLMISAFIENSERNENTTSLINKIELQKPSIKSEIDFLKNENKKNIIKSSEHQETINKLTAHFDKEVKFLQSTIGKQELNILEKQDLLDKSIKDLTLLCDKEITENSTKIKIIIENITSLHDGFKQSLSLKSEEVDKLIGTISDKALAGNYSKYAEEEKKEADKMRIISSGFMLISIALGIGSFFESMIHEISNSTFISRIIFAIVLSIPAAYFARESTKHRNQQQHFRKIDLDLKAVGPYSLSLPDKDQHELKKDIASKIFAKDLTTKNEKSYPIDIQELILEIVKSATNEVKQKSEKNNSDTEKSS